MANPYVFTLFGIGVGQQPFKEHPLFPEDPKTQRLHHSRARSFFLGLETSIWGSGEFRPYFGPTLIYTREAFGLEERL
jgi:hypothetical protein